MDAVYEEVVKPPKRYAPLIRKRILFVAAYVLFFVAWAPVVFLFPDAVFVIAVLDVSLTAAFVLFTVHRLKPEFEYELFGERLTVSEIFGGRARKTRLKLDVRKIEFAAPVTDERAEKVDVKNVEKVYNAAFGRGDGCFVAIFDDDGDRAVLFFAPSDELLKRMGKFNRKITL